MLSRRQVIKLLRQDAAAFQKDLERLCQPDELHRQFEQVMERFEQERLEELGLPRRQHDRARLRVIGNDYQDADVPEGFFGRMIEREDDPRSA